MTKQELEQLWATVGCAEPLKKAVWRQDGAANVPQRRYSSQEDERAANLPMRDETRRDAAR